MQTTERNRWNTKTIDDLFTLSGENDRAAFGEKLQTDFQNAFIIDQYVYEFDNQPIPDTCAQGISHTEATLEAAIDDYEDAVTFGNWLSLIMQGSCSTLQKQIQFESVMLNNNGVMTQR